MGLDRLCFGTSTFVAGRLRPDKDSGPGMAALHAAILAGVRLIHSNPKLLTQWAIRRVLDQTDHAATVRHLIKVEAPLDANRATLETVIEEAVTVSRQLLGVDRLFAVVLEIDAKRSKSDSLDNLEAAHDFYQRGAEAVLATDVIDHVLGYCHQDTHLTAALNCPQIIGVAAQYHRAAPWVVPHLPYITSVGKIFIGMSPLARGTLVDYTAEQGNRLAALRWAWADPRVNAVTITMSSPQHFREVVDTLGLRG